MEENKVQLKSKCNLHTPLTPRDRERERGRSFSFWVHIRLEGISLELEDLLRSLVENTFMEKVSTLWSVSTVLAYLWIIHIFSYAVSLYDTSNFLYSCLYVSCSTWWSCKPPRPSRMSSSHSFLLDNIPIGPAQEVIPLHC